MKTILEHLNTLRQPYRKQAIENIYKLKPAYYLDFILQSEEEDLSSSLLQSFYWEMTTQGHNYWSDIANNPKKYQLKRYQI